MDVNDRRTNVVELRIPCLRSENPLRLHVSPFSFLIPCGVFGPEIGKHSGGKIRCSAVSPDNCTSSRDGGKTFSEDRPMLTACLVKERKGTKKGRTFLGLWRSANVDGVVNFEREMGEDLGFGAFRCCGTV